jgi:ATP/maltotriose-dependent transcriptional regulator MalT
MVAHVFSGHWGELEALAAELLEANDQRPGAEYPYCALAFLDALRGRHDSALASLERLSAWERTEDIELKTMHTAATVSVALAAGHTATAVEQGQRMLGPAMQTLGAGNQSVRFGWPDTLHAALALGRLQDARSLLALLADQPPGHIPPYLNAQLARGRGLLAAAEGEHDAVETHLTGAIDGLRALGYPYWLAVTQTDFGAWLINRNRDNDATSPLNEAIATLKSLDAAPALARAKGLSRSPTDTIAT